LACNRNTAQVIAADSDRVTVCRQGDGGRLTVCNKKIFIGHSIVCSIPRRRYGSARCFIKVAGEPSFKQPKLAKNVIMSDLLYLLTVVMLKAHHDIVVMVLSATHR
jgi:hypothetical protein